MSERRTVLANTISLYALQGANMIFPLLLVPYLLRVVGVEGYGALTYTASAIQLLVVLTGFSFNYTATQVVSTQRTDTRLLSELLTIVTLAKAALALLAGAILALLVLLVPPFRRHALLLAVQFTMVIGEVLFPQWLFLGLQRMGLVTLLNVISRTVTLGAIVLLVHQPEDLTLAGALQAGHFLLAGVLAQFVTVRVLGVRYRRHIRRHHVTRLLRDSAQVFAGTLSSHVYARGAMLVLGFFATPAALGQFAVAHRIFGLFTTLVSPITQSLYPHVCRLWEEARARCIQLRVRILLLTLLGATGVLALMNVSAPWIVRALAGDFVPEIVTLIRYFTPVIAVTALNVMLNMFVMAQKRYAEMRRMYIVAALVFLLTGPLLGYMWGARGMILALLVVESYVLLRSWAFTRPTELESLINEATPVGTASGEL